MVFFRHSARRSLVALMLIISPVIASAQSTPPCTPLRDPAILDHPDVQAWIEAIANDGDALNFFMTRGLKASIAHAIGTSSSLAGSPSSSGASRPLSTSPGNPDVGYQLIDDEMQFLLKEELFDDLWALTAAITAAPIKAAMSEGFDTLLENPRIAGVGIGFRQEQGRSVPAVRVFCASDLDGGALDLEIRDWENHRDELCLTKKEAGQFNAAVSQVNLFFNPTEASGTPSKNLLGFHVVQEPSASIGPSESGLKSPFAGCPTDPPYPIGCGAGHSRVRPGTIGCRVVGTTGEPDAKEYALGCNHVFGATGQGVPYRDRIKGNPGGINEHVIGTLSKFEPIDFASWNEVDAAIVELGPDTVSFRTPDSGYGLPAPALAPAICVGNLVMKHGAQTGCTCGEVIAVHAKFKIEYGPDIAFFKDQIVVRPTKCQPSGPNCSGSKAEGFCAQGDSGALVVTKFTSVQGSESIRPVGLAIAGTTKQTVVNRIGPVLDALDVTIASHPSHTIEIDPPPPVERLPYLPPLKESQRDISFVANVAYDSNAAPLDESRSNSVDLSRFEFAGDLDYRFARSPGEGGVDIGLSVSGDAQNESPVTAPLEVASRISWDRDWPERPDHRIKQVSFGIRGDSSWSWIQDDHFEDNLAVTAALMTTWGRHGNCELDNTVISLSQIERNDAWSLNPEYYRDGEIFVAGLEHTVFSDHFDPNLDCERAGPFRRILRSDSLTYYFGAEYARQRADGTEIGSSTVTVHWGGEQPVWKKPFSIDWYGEASRSRFDNSSVKLPGARHEEDSVLLDVGWRWRVFPAGNRKRPLSHLDLRAGISWESVNSNVDFYDYNRTVITFGIDLRRFKQKRNNGAPIITETGGSRARRRSSQSGTSPAQVPSGSR